MNKNQIVASRCIVLNIKITCSRWQSFNVGRRVCRIHTDERIYIYIYISGPHISCTTIILHNLQRSAPAEELGSERRYLMRRRRGEPSLELTEDTFVSVVRLSEESGASPTCMDQSKETVKVEDEMPRTT